MRYLPYLVLVAILALVSVRLPPGLVGRGAAPVLLLVPALLAGFNAPAAAAAVFGWTAGFAADLFSLEPFGLHALLFGGAAYAVARLADWVFVEHPAGRAAISGGAAFVVLLALLVRLELSEPAFRAAARLPAAFLSAALTGLAVPLLGTAARRLRLFPEPPSRTGHV